MSIPRLLFACVLGWLAALPASGQTPPDFSGQWTLDTPAIATTAAVPGTPAAAAAPGDMGSGWGSPLTITQTARQLSVEYAFFSRYDAQPPLVFVFPLDGSEGKNVVNMGRGDQTELSRAKWDGQSLVITTTHLALDRGVDKGAFTVQVTRKLTLESPTTLIVEVTRGGVQGGAETKTRARYLKN